MNRFDRVLLGVVALLIAALVVLIVLYARAGIL
jgi:hypothetical protein